LSWDAAAIDAFLMRLAWKLQGELIAGWPAVRAAGERYVLRNPRQATAWRHLVAAGPRSIQFALLGRERSHAALRAIIPYHVVLSRSVIEEELKKSALAGPLGKMYAERWEDDGPEANFVDWLVEGSLAAVGSGEPVLRAAFTDFVIGSGEMKWIIGADFCLHDETRHNDVFAFTVFPGDTDFVTLSNEIASIFPRDAKKTRDVTPEMIAFLRSQRRFHFAFVVNKDRQFMADVNTAREAIDRTLEMLNELHDVADQQDAITQTRRLRQEANSNNFNARLFQDMVLMAAFAGIITLLLQLEGRAERIIFMPDRDDMTSAYRAVVHWMFAQNASAFALRRKIPEAPIAIGLPGPRNDGRKGSFIDEVVRLPDYIASAVAGTDLNRVQPVSLSQKAGDIIGKAFVDSSNIALLRVDLPPRLQLVRRTIVSSKSPMEI
jgi:hypothetical protein